MKKNRSKDVAEQEQRRSRTGRRKNDGKDRGREKQRLNKEKEEKLSLK